MVNWGDPGTFWLNVTNAALGVFTVVAFAIVLGAVVVELVERLKKRVASAAADAHTLHLPALGPTMADGGERIKGGKEKKDPGKRP
jgi:hypothetical protein